MEKRDGTAISDKKQGAYDRLAALQWRQLLTQARQVYEILEFAADILGWDSSAIRSGEQMNGWLQLCVSDSAISGAGTDQQDAGSTQWQERFCAIQNNLFMVYENEQSVTPEELICLQFAQMSVVIACDHTICGRVRWVYV